MPKYISWDALGDADAGQQHIEWGANLELHSAGDTITISPSNILNLLQFVLDTAVTNEQRSPGGDKYFKARNALGASAGVSFSGFTAAVTASRGVVLTETGTGYTFDVAEPHKFAVAVASLCQSAIPTAAGLLARM